MRPSRLSGCVVLLGAALHLALAPPVQASPAPVPISTCRTLTAPGHYAVAADLATTDATCLVVAASHVTLNLAGHTLTCTGSGFDGSCQTDAFGPTAVSLGPGLVDVVVNGPGQLRGFDNGVVVPGTAALVQGLTITGPLPCDPSTCQRPTSNGIIVTGGAGAAVSGNSISGYAYGVRLFFEDCPSSASCVVNGNVLEDNSCHGVALVGSTGYAVTRNVVARSSSDACFPDAGIGVDHSSGMLVTNNDVSDNYAFGIGVAPETDGNAFVNNVARRNALPDLFAVPGTVNRWADNNRCWTEGGAVPATVCNPGE